MVLGFLSQHIDLLDEAQILANRCLDGLVSLSLLNPLLDLGDIRRSSDCCFYKLVVLSKSLVFLLPLQKNGLKSLESLCITFGLSLDAVVLSLELDVLAAYLLRLFLELDHRVLGCPDLLLKKQVGCLCGVQ